jgi:hypothetical protein
MLDSRAQLTARISSTSGFAGNGVTNCAKTPDAATRGLCGHEEVGSMLSECSNPSTSTTPVRRVRYVGLQSAAVTALLLGCSSGDGTAGSQSGNQGYLQDGGHGAATGAGGGFVGTGGGVAPGPATCGNNIVEAGENCDGPVTNTTCAQATMGSKPIGNVSCTGCQIDTSGCTSTGSGGVTGAGGAVGAGGAGNTGNVGGTAGASGGTGTGGTTALPGGGTTPSHLPTVNGTCPPLQTGPVTVTVNGKTMNWHLWVGANNAAGAGGPIMIYWHATGMTYTEVNTGLGAAGMQEIQSLGGIVASADSTSTTGANTGNNVWYTGDVDFADQIIACAIQQQHIDTRHIHVGGYSAGGLQTVYHWYARSGYVASVVSYSGGAAVINQTQLQDPSHAPAAIAAHGAPGSDALGIDFANASASWETAIKGAGGFVIDCNDGSSHVDIAKRMAIAPQAWQFFKDHPYGVSPEPYGALPAGWPSYCSIK